MNIYVGYGLKTNQMAFVPAQPDDLLGEVDDTDEYPEVIFIYIINIKELIQFMWFNYFRFI